MSRYIDTLPNNLSELRTGTANDGRMLVATGTDPRRQESVLRDLRRRLPAGWSAEIYAASGADAVITHVGRGDHPRWRCVMSTLATIRSARGCVSHQGDEPWAIRTICEQSELDVHPTEVTILRHDGSGTSPTGLRYVAIGATILGTYSLELIGGAS